jgi:hypothetical protein
MKRIPIDQFGRDHWSTFAYIETLCVDKQGKPEHDRMRCNKNRHVELLGPAQLRTSNDWQESWSTRLKGHTDKRPKQVSGHDDWDCAEDLQHAGLIEVHGTGLYPYFKMTVPGFACAALLRQHKAKGGNFSDFTLPKKYLIDLAILRACEH